MRPAILAVAAGTLLVGRTAAAPFHRDSSGPCLMPHGEVKAFTSWLACRDHMYAVGGLPPAQGASIPAIPAAAMDQLAGLTREKTAKISREAHALAPLERERGTSSVDEKQPRGAPLDDMEETGYELDGGARPLPLDLLRHKLADGTERNGMAREMSADDETEGAVHEKRKRTLLAPSEECDCWKDGRWKYQDDDDWMYPEDDDWKYPKEDGIQWATDRPGHEWGPEDKKALEEADAAAIEKWRSMTPEELAALYDI